MSWPALADHAGRSYLRYSFTKGTEQEVEFLSAALELRAGDRILDIGCGPGRHSQALNRRGMRVIGVDLALGFLRLAQEESPPGHPGPGFVQADVRALPVRPASFDVAICLCQGGFGLLGGTGEESAALGAMAGALRPGGRLALSAFSSWYAVRWLGEGERFDASTAVLHETAKVWDRSGTEEAGFSLASTCFTPRELTLMAEAAGLTVEAIWSVEPGRYGPHPPDVDRPEWLMIARA